MNEQFQCLKCNNTFKAASGPKICTKCSSARVKWISYNPNRFEGKKNG